MLPPLPVSQEKSHEKSRETHMEHIDDMLGMGVMRILSIWSINSRGMLKMAKLTNYEANKVREAAVEIRGLRHRLEVAEARLSGFDGALVLLHAYTAPGQGVGMGEDVVWALDRMAEGEPEVPPTGGPVEEREPGPAQHLHNRVEEGPAASPQKSDFIEKGVRPPFRPDDAL